MMLWHFCEKRQGKAGDSEQLLVVAAVFHFYKKVPVHFCQARIYSITGILRSRVSREGDAGDHRHIQ